MLAKLLAHLRRQWMGALALFLVLTGGTAWAVDEWTGANIVNGSLTSADYRNNNVQSVDLKDDAAVKSPDVVNDTVTGGGLSAVDLRAGAVGGSEVVDNALTGADIDESSLGEVPSATLGGLGGRPNSAPFSCDPESTTFFSCGASAGVDLPAPSRVLVIGEIRAEPDTGNGNGGGSCKVSGMPSPAPVFVNGGQTDVMTVSGITDVLGSGTYSFNMVCNETASGIRYFDGNVNVVALSPDG